VRKSKMFREIPTSIIIITILTAAVSWSIVYSQVDWSSKILVLSLLTTIWLLGSLGIAKTMILEPWEMEGEKE